MERRGKWKNKKGKETKKRHGEDRIEKRKGGRKEGKVRKRERNAEKKINLDGEKGKK